MNTILESDRIRYRKFTAKDLPTYLSMITSDEIMKFITKRGLTKKEGTKRFEKVMEQTNRHPDFGYFFAYRKEDNKLLGLVKLVEFARNDFELGYALFPDFWGQKYATEMVQWFVQYSKDHSLRKLTAIVDPDNPVSIRLLINNGFKLTKKGTFKNEPAHYYLLRL